MENDFVKEETKREFLKKKKKIIPINSYSELLEHESEILRRISLKPNGGNLFLIHPFMLLKDVGVNLSEKAKAEIMVAEPHLVGLSAVPYNALKASRAHQNYRIHLKGLFRREEI